MSLGEKNKQLHTHTHPFMLPTGVWESTGNLRRGTCGLFWFWLLIDLFCSWSWYSRACMVTQWAVNGYFHYGSFSSGPRALLNTMSILEAKCEQHVSRAAAATAQHFCLCWYRMYQAQHCRSSMFWEWSEPSTVYDKKIVHVLCAHSDS